MLADRARVRRLQANLSQAGLSERAGVSLGSLKRFERTGEIAFVSLIRLAYALDAIAEFSSLFPELNVELTSIDEIIRSKHVRRRGRRK
jgi:transcriptional regulator with XRE-family HTH domain